jgi:hypothetical protein
MTLNATVPRNDSERRSAQNDVYAALALEHLDRADPTLAWLFPPGKSPRLKVLLLVPSYSYPAQRRPSDGADDESLPIPVSANTPFRRWRAYDPLPPRAAGLQAPPTAHPSRFRPPFPYGAASVSARRAVLDDPVAIGFAGDDFAFAHAYRPLRLGGAEQHLPPRSIRCPRLAFQRVRPSLSCHRPPLTTRIQVTERLAVPRCTRLLRQLDPASPRSELRPGAALYACVDWSGT